MAASDPLLVPFPQRDDGQHVFMVRAVGLGPEFRPRLHRHDFYEVAWLTRGRAAFFSDFERYSLDSGALAFVSPGQVHKLDGDWTQIESYVLGFRPQALTMHGRDASFLHELPFYDSPHRPILPVEPALKELFDRLFVTAFERFEAGGKGYQEILGAYLNLVLVEARRVYQAPAQARRPSAARRLDRRFRHAIEAHLLERLKVQDYAQMLHVTPDHLTRAVRQTSGSTPGKLLDERLALEAQRRLVHTDDDVAEIGYGLAFSSPAQFNNWFKKLAGRSPGRFRREMRAELRTGA